MPPEGLKLGDNTSWQKWGMQYDDNTLRINPDDLVTAEPFANMGRRLEILEVVVQILARKLGMSDEEAAEMLKAAATARDTAKTLMEE